MTSTIQAEISRNEALPHGRAGGDLFLDVFISTLTAAPISKFAACLQEVVDSLELADPRLITSAQGDPDLRPVDILEIKIGYQEGCKTFDDAYAELQKWAGRVRMLSDSYGAAIESRVAQVEEIEARIRSEQEYLGGPSAPDAAEILGLSGRLRELAVIATLQRACTLQAKLSLSCGLEFLDGLDRLPEGMVSRWISYRSAPMTGHQIPQELTNKSLSSYILLHDSLSGLLPLAERANEQERITAAAAVREIVGKNDLEVDDIFRLRGGRWEMMREARVSKNPVLPAAELRIQGPLRLRRL